MGMWFSRWLPVGLAWIAAIAVARAATPSPAASPFVVTAEAVQKLTVSQGATPIPVRLRGVVTFSEPRCGLLYVQDETGGVYCEPGLLPYLPPIGTAAELEGVAGPGSFLPVVLTRELRELGLTNLPLARPVRAEQLWKGEFDGDFVRVSGYVCGVELKTDPVAHLNLRLASQGREVMAKLITPPSPSIY